MELRRRSHLELVWRRYLDEQHQQHQRRFYYIRRIDNHLWWIKHHVGRFDNDIWRIDYRRGVERRGVERRGVKRR